MWLYVLLSLGLLAPALAANEEATTEETPEKRLLVFPPNELTSPGGYCQSPLGVTGLCIPYQECRFLFDDETVVAEVEASAEASVVASEETDSETDSATFSRSRYRHSRDCLGRFNPVGHPSFLEGGGGGRPGGGGGRPGGVIRRPGGGGGRLPYTGQRQPATERPRPQDLWGTKDCGVASSALVRIVGGRESNLGAWPWITLLFIDVHGNGVRSPLCGGALVTPRHVLTAAHCTFSGNRSLTPDAFVARLGEHDYLSSDDGASPVDEPVVRIDRHAEFNPRTYLNDVAVLTLRRPVPLNKDIALICLPYGTLRDDAYESRSANIAGWGELYYGGPSSATLQDTRIPIQSLDTCKESFKRTSITFTDHYPLRGQPEGRQGRLQGRLWRTANAAGRATAVHHHRHHIVRAPLCGTRISGRVHESSQVPRLDPAKARLNAPPGGAPCK
ncbi:hypothetical protein MRX96_038326 [Rhipicephalus microplus]